MGNIKPKVEKDRLEVGEGKTRMGIQENEYSSGGEKDMKGLVASSVNQIVLESMNQSTRYHAIASRLRDLDRYAK